MTYKGYSIYEMGGDYVIHFLAIQDTDSKNGINAVNIAYSNAVKFAKKYGGKKFHNNSFGGGIIFYSLNKLKTCIDEAENNKININQ